ncbi:uncharacterized protein [Ambystoma mexicanum]|uniref:uncharacterized protein n=1 Tax=Ambystoma mexicanum TaxID=8296 RepID=UPI0037E71E2A
MEWSTRSKATERSRIISSEIYPMSIASNSLDLQADDYDAVNGCLEDVNINSETLIAILHENGLHTIDSSAVTHDHIYDVRTVDAQQLEVEDYESGTFELARDASVFIADPHSGGAAPSSNRTIPHTAGIVTSDDTDRPNPGGPAPPAKRSLKRKKPTVESPWACVAAEEVTMQTPSVISPAAPPAPTGQIHTGLLYNARRIDAVLDGAVEAVLNKRKKHLSLNRERVSQGCGAVLGTSNPQCVIVPNNHIPLPIESLIPVAYVNAEYPQETQVGGVITQGPVLPVVGSENLLDRGPVSPRLWTPS